jgi:hypothetical protein
MDYPKMLYDADGKATTVDSAEGEAEIRKQGYMTLAELSAQRGAYTAPSADQQGTGVDTHALPARSVYTPDAQSGGGVAPVVKSLDPASGDDGTQLTISGTGFQPQGPSSQV